MTRRLFLIVFCLLAGPVFANDSAGFIYGTVTLEEGESHTGFIRWDVEEAFWDDLFHSRQTENPWLDHVDMEEIKAERRRRYFETHGMLDRIMWTLHNKNHDMDLTRLFISRFGYLDEIRVDEDEEVTLLVADGLEVPVRGYANDVTSDLLVYTGSGDPVEIEWDDLALIRLFQAPDEAQPYARRLYGTVQSSAGEFEGYIQWDESECVTTDILDGDEGTLEMGEILTLTKNRKGTSDIVLKNGDSLTLSGTNDVASGNRGIMVENPAWGRATVGWNRFRSITFAEGHGSGPGKADFAPVTPLQGTVTDVDGGTATGRIVYDLDEAWSRDVFNGIAEDVVYDIPFSLITSIEKTGDLTCRVSLESGLVLELGEGQDAGDKHAGVLVFVSGEEEARFFPWSRFASVTFAR